MWSCGVLEQVAVDRLAHYNYYGLGIFVDCAPVCLEGVVTLAMVVGYLGLHEVASGWEI